MMNKLDIIFQQILNDKDIFYPKEVIFDNNEWTTFKKLYFQEKNEKLEDMIDNKVELYKKQSFSKNVKDRILDALRSLKNSLTESPNLVMGVLLSLNTFSFTSSNLPKDSKLNDLGVIIERYDFSIFKQYTLNLIKKSGFHNKKALRRIMEYVESLYNSEISAEIIAYFIRKLNLLKNYWEVLK